MNYDETGDNRYHPSDDDTQHVPPDGWPSLPAVPPSRSRGWRSLPRAALVAIVVTGLLVIGGTAFGISSMTDNGTSPRSVAYPSTTSTPDDAQNGSISRLGVGRCMAIGRWLRRHAILGELTDMSGEQWTVKTLQRGTFTVAINDDTEFGTKRREATRDDFTVGSKVGVVGEIQDQTITARRIIMPKR